MYSNKTALGCDIGGTHITCGIINVEGKELVEGTLKRRYVDANAAGHTVITSWAACMRESMGELHVPSLIGIAMPGPFDYENGISLIKGQEKYEKLYGLHVQELLAGELDMDAECIHFYNDAACFLQGEMFAGAGKGYNDAVGLTLGTGLGSSRSKNGHVHDANLWCAPFKKGIAEDYLSTRWFLSSYLLLSGEEVKGVKELVERYDEEPRIGALFEDFGHQLGEFIISHFEEDLPEMLILGGNIARAAHHFLPSAHRVLNQCGMSMNIRQAALGELSAMYGAVDLAMDADNSLSAKQPLGE